MARIRHLRYRLLCRVKGFIGVMSPSGLVLDYKGADGGWVARRRLRKQGDNG